MKRSAPLLALAALLVVATGVLAMDSAGYKLTHFTVSGNGGGKVASAHYTARFTVGQSVIGATSSTGYETCLGYWCGAEPAEYRVYLPLVVRGP